MEAINKIEGNASARQTIPRQRAARRVVNSGYSESGASYRKKALKGMVPNSGNPIDDIHENNATLRQRSRMLYMGAPIATSAIKTNRTNVIGVGLKLKSKIDREALGMSKEAAEAWQKHTEAEFELWSERKEACDATGINNFAGMQQLAFISWLLSGDCIVLQKQKKRTAMYPYGLRLHIIEADRVRTPVNNASAVIQQTTGKTKDGNYIYDGVEVDSDGCIVAYHIANTYPSDMIWQGTKHEFARVEAYGRKTRLPNVMHIMDSERPEQYRGVPYLAHVIEPLLQLRRYTEAEIMNAVIQSFLTAFITTEADTSDNPFNEVHAGNEQVSHDPNEYELGAGTINLLEPGEDVKFSTPTHPNSGFEAFVNAMCEQVGSALEIPKDLLLKSFNASYSASRGALLEAWKAFKMRREWFADDFCKPAYEIWLTEAVALGRIAAPGFFTDPIIRQAYLSSEWIGGAMGSLDPTKDINAAILSVENGFSTRSQETIKLNGGDFNANSDQLVTENEKLKLANGAQDVPIEQQFTNMVGKIVKNTLKKEGISGNEQREND